MDSNETTKQADMAGMGIALLSLHTIRLEMEAKRFIVLDVESLSVMRRCYIAHRAGKRRRRLPWRFGSSYWKKARRCSVKCGRKRKIPRQKASGKLLPGKDARRGNGPRLPRLGVPLGKA